MSINAVTHVNFRGDARAALTFYQSVFGGETIMITYKDAESARDPAEADQVMWGQVVADNGFRIMAYDVPSSIVWNRGENSFFVSVRSADAEEITTCWEKLSEQATILQPLAPAQWAPLYGMLTDRFGVTWVLDVASSYPS